MRLNMRGNWRNKIKRSMFMYTESRPSSHYPDILDEAL
jgi:hypothetical protein